MIPAMVGNLRAAGLTGRDHDESIVIGQKDVRALTPDDVRGMLPASASMGPGVFCFNPPYGVRIGAEGGDRALLELYAAMGRAMGRFTGWRAACFVAHPRFVEAFGHVPTMTKPASRPNADLSLVRGVRS
jgi:23S rRNA G2445 N2-methylase RlmL